MTQKRKTPGARAGAAGGNDGLCGSHGSNLGGGGSQAVPARDAFAAAKDGFVMGAVCHPCAAEAAVKIAAALAIRFASRREFEATGQLVAWPSLRTLAEVTGLFRSRIDRGVKLLEGIGLITVERPETRGATHHNRYVLRFENGRMGAAIDDAKNGRTTVANSKAENGRMGAAIHEGNNGRMGAATMAAPVGPNLLDNPPEEGAGASRPPAPETEISGEDGEAVSPIIHAGAAERARITASDLELLHDTASPYLEAAPKEGEPITLADLDRLADEERTALADNDRDPLAEAAADLADLHPDLDEPEGFVGDLLAGFGDGDAAATHRAARQSAKLLLASGPEARRVWTGHRRVLARLLAAAGHDAGQIDRALSAFQAAAGVAGETIKAERRRRAVDETAEMEAADG